MNFQGHTSMTEESVFSVADNGDLMLTMRGTLFPTAGGVQCGSSLCQINFSEHIRQIIRAEMKAAGADDPGQ